MTTMQIVIVVLVAVAVIALVLFGLVWWRHRSLRNRFGPEYDRLVSERDSRLAADRELHARERKHRDLELRPLDPGTRERYVTAWREVQARFVDSPETAIDAADDLLTQLVADRGYPTGDYQEQLDQLSVDHARTLARYRDAHQVYLRHQQGEATTEDLRQALTDYRALFGELLGEEPVEPAGPDGTVTTSGDRPETEGTRHG